MNDKVLIQGLGSVMVRDGPPCSLLSSALKGCQQLPWTAAAAAWAGVGCFHSTWAAALELTTWGRERGLFNLSSYVGLPEASCCLQRKSADQVGVFRSVYVYMTICE